MKIVIETTVFADQANTIALLNIGYWALKGRHRLLVEDDAAPLFLSWLGGLNEVMRSDWRTIMNDSYQREALEPAKREFHIAPDQLTDWNRTPARLNITDAVQFVSLPFHILLEDSVSDRNFLLKMATADQRKALISRHADNEVVFEHGGGIGSMTRRVTTMQRDPQSRLRSWAMFDSDALQPTRPSSQSEMLRQCCIEVQIPHYQLARRSIENYLPKNAIRIWAYMQKSEREARFLALLKLSDDQRYHYNFKQGFAGDEDRPAPGAGELYDGLSEQIAAALQRGFGSNIGDLFAGETVTEQDLRRDSGWSEMNPVITELIALLR
jgi:hypothetical protein